MVQGIVNGLGDLVYRSSARTRSISPENFTGEKGAGAMATEGTGAEAARDLGRGWKVSPSIKIEPGEERLLGAVDEAGVIQQIWLTQAKGNWRHSILRFYWDGQETPSVETPLGDFFLNGWNRYAPVSSLAVCVNSNRGFNSYWQMPFGTSARITLENLADEPITLYYQINYIVTEVPSDALYFHAQFRRSNPLPYKETHTLLDGVRGAGHYVGTYMAWGVNSNNWWGEGEIKFYLDGDAEFPTICGTGTEDYFCGAYDFDVGFFEEGAPARYQEFTTPYSGLHQVIRPDGAYRSQQRFGMYRWHIVDPIRFESDISVDIQALGWRHDGRYLPLQDDIASVSFWYQTLPTTPHPPLPDRDYLEVI